MKITTANQFTLVDYMVEPLKKRPNETDLEALRRIVVDHAQKGWELADACGDELRMPMLIFHKAPLSESTVLYDAEEITSSGGDEIQNVTQWLWQRRDQGWLPVCILDSPVSKPIAVFKKLPAQAAQTQIKAIVVPLEILEKIGNTINYELLDQQVKDNLTLACIMHGGLNPVLIMISKAEKTSYEYLIEHAKGGIFSNQTRTLTDLISSRSSEGWQVCGAFEDNYLWPCVAFKRPTTEVPIIPSDLEIDA